MPKRKRNLAAVGLLTIVAAAIFFWGLFWMLGAPVFRGGMDVTLLLSDGGGLKRSDRVQVQGVQVGTVRSIDLNPKGGVVVGLRLEREDLALPTDTRAAISGDVFGAHVVDLIPGSSAISISPGDTLQGVATPQLSQIATDLSSRVESVLVSADRLLSPAAVADVHETAAVLPASAQELRAAFAELRLAAISLRRTAEGVEDAETGAALSSAISEVERSAQSLTSAAGRLEESLVSFASVMDKIDSGSGTLGRLVNDETMYDEMNNTLREMRALAADIRERPSRYINVRVF
ncbi:MAG TPA: MlaD family protein [Longimicrobiales bacterium]|nr:MlaD family protein [Longimicrobiales bacterium]